MSEQNTGLVIQVSIENGMCVCECVNVCICVWMPWIWCQTNISFVCITWEGGHCVCLCVHMCVHWTFVCGFKDVSLVLWKHTT